MSKGSDRALALGLAALASGTGIWAVSAATHVPRRVVLDAPLARGGEMAIHLELVLALSILLVVRISARSSFSPRTANLLRAVGWSLVAAFFVANAMNSERSGHGRDLFLAVTTVVVPIWPLLGGALLFDLGLLVDGRESRSEGGVGPPPPFAIVSGLFGGLAPLAFVGFLAVIAHGLEFPGAPLFEALACDSVWALPFFLVLAPIALVWGFVALMARFGFREVGA